MMTDSEFLARYTVACQFNQPARIISIKKQIREWIRRCGGRKNMDVYFPTTWAGFQEAHLGEDSPSLNLLAVNRKCIGQHLTPQAALVARMATASWASLTAGNIAIAASGFGGLFRPVWDVMQWSTRVLVGIRDGNLEMYETWLPLFRAAECGAWQVFIGEKAVSVLTVPEVHVDEQNRLHHDRLPAFVSMSVYGYYQHGQVCRKQDLPPPITLIT